MQDMKPRYGARIIGVGAETHPSNPNEQILAVRYELDGAEHWLKLEHAQAISLLLHVDQLVQKFGRSNLAANLRDTLAGLKAPPGKKPQ